jgi:hypothetical protein
LWRKQGCASGSQKWHSGNRGPPRKGGLPLPRGAWRAPEYRKGRAVTPFDTSEPFQSKAGLPRQSCTRSLISSELPFSSGAYIADATAGKALNLPGISARIR